MFWFAADRESIGWSFRKRQGLQELVSRALTVSKQRHSFTGDEPLEMIALLVGSEGWLVRKELVEEKLRRIVLPAANQEQFDTGLLLRLRQEATEDGGNLVGFARLS